VEIDNQDLSKPSRTSFLRIRALIPIEDPLPTGFLLQRPPKQPTVISYQYECLSEFCYDCGRLGHPSYHCNEVLDPLMEGKYGPKLKASPPNANRVEMLLPARRGQSSNAIPGTGSHDHPKPSPESTHETSDFSQLNTQTVTNSSPKKLPSPITPNLTVLSHGIAPMPQNPVVLNEKSSLVNSSLILSQGPTKSTRPFSTNSFSPLSTNPVEIPTFSSSSLTTQSTATLLSTNSHHNIQSAAKLLSTSTQASFSPKTHLPLLTQNSPTHPEKPNHTKERFHPYPKHQKLNHDPVFPLGSPAFTMVPFEEENVFTSPSVP
jgi:hypothetical protein